MRLLILLIILSFCGISESQNYWIQQRDDITAYSLDTSVENVRSSLECSTMALPQHQALDFQPSGSTCRLYSCRFGQNGCRKCRNAKNTSMPLLLVRSLNAQGHSGWRTFQHRVDGSVDFYRTWTDYVNGFGQGEDLNFWMGLEAIHQLTQTGDRRVRWEMRSWDDSWFWWEDVSFSVQGSASGYQLTVGVQDVANSNVIQCPPTSNAYMNGQKFTTKDKDQDKDSTGNCAVKFQGAWWYNACHCFHPNGKYFTPPTAYDLRGDLWAAGLTFENLADHSYPLRHSYSMLSFECMVSDIC